MPFVEPLSAHHDRKGFDCGSPPLNAFLQRQARQNADRNLGVTRIVVAERGDSKILGYYTLVTSVIASAAVPHSKLPGGNIGVILLGRLATDQNAQGQGLGRRMLLRAMYEAALVSHTVGVYAMTLDAIDEAARDWYLSLDFGFETLADDPNHLYIPISYIQQLRQPALTDEL
jgi:GNAT superfamily N-acetyltransferase